MVGGGAPVTVNVYWAPAELEPAVAVTTKLKVPPWDGVPESRPVAGSSDSPPGIEPPVTLQVIGAAPAAVKVAV